MAHALQAVARPISFACEQHRQSHTARCTALRSGEADDLRRRMGTAQLSAVLQQYNAALRQLYDLALQHQVARDATRAARNDNAQSTRAVQRTDAAPAPAV